MIVKYEIPDERDRRYTSRQRQILRLRNQGRTYSQIATMMKISYTTVYKDHQKTMVALNQSKAYSKVFLSETEKLIVDLRREGKTFREIGAIVGICKKTVTTLFNTVMTALDREIESEHKRARQSLPTTIEDHVVHP